MEPLPVKSLETVDKRRLRSRVVALTMLTFLGGGVQDVLVYQRLDELGPRVHAPCSTCLQARASTPSRGGR